MPDNSSVNSDSIKMVSECYKINLKLSIKLVCRYLWENICLYIYLFIVLEIASYFGQSAYTLISWTGHFFRSKDIFSSSVGRRGALQIGLNNLKIAGIPIADNGEAILNEYCRFESRFALENIWIRKNNRERIIKAFNSDDLENLKKTLEKQQFIIATPHTSANYLFITLINILGHDAPCVIINPFAEKIKYPSPFQSVLLRVFTRWNEIAKFIFMQDGKVFERCKNILRSGRSLIIAPDTPFHSKNNETITFMNRKTGVASGIAVLAKQCGVRVLAVSHWAENCTSPYRINIKPIDVIDTLQCMQDIFHFFETGIKKNPTCWNGWLYWDLMDHVEYREYINHEL